MPDGLRARLVVHPALHPRSLLHVRVLVRAARRAAALPPLPRGSRRRSHRSTSSCSPPAARPRRPTSSRRSASTCARPTPGARRSQSSTRLREEAETLSATKRPRSSVCELASSRARPAPAAALPRLRARPDTQLCARVPRGAASADAAALRALRRADGVARRALPRVRGPAARVRDGAGGRRRTRTRVRRLVAGWKERGLRSLGRRCGRASSPSGCRARRRRASRSSRPTRTAASSAAITRPSSSRERSPTHWRLPCEPLLAAVRPLAPAARALARASAAATSPRASRREPCAGAGSSSSTTSTRPAPRRRRRGGAPARGAAQSTSSRSPARFAAARVGLGRG